ncbi:MAG: molybdenum cofactor cytidylyltransferase [Chloroflexota bacterium]
MSLGDGRTARDKVAGLILAGGHSRRLGRPKQSLPFGTGTLLEHAVLQAESVRAIDPIVVVLPSGDPFPHPRTSRAVLTHVNGGDACSSSLHAGLRMLPDGLAATVVLSSDQPALSGELIGLAVATWMQARPLALTLSYRGEWGHPLIFSASLFSSLLALHGEKAMWRLLDALGDAVQRLEVDIPLPHDIDTPEDYERLLAGTVKGTL